jgi:phosphoglycolate phosphatase
MTSPRIVVFDLDGTLVDTAPDLINALNFVLDREGLPPVPLASARNMIGAGARKLIERGLEVEGRGVSVEELNRLTRDFIDYYAEHIADESRPFEGLDAALDDLQSRGYRFAVCTNKLEWLSKLLLDRLDLTRRFSAICGADTFGVAKPDPPSCTRPSPAPAGSPQRQSWSGFRNRHRRGPPGRDFRGRGLVRLYRHPYRRAEAGPADRPHEGPAGSGRKSAEIKLIADFPMFPLSLAVNHQLTIGLPVLSTLLRSRVDCCRRNCPRGSGPGRLLLAFARHLQINAIAGAGEPRLHPVGRGGAHVERTELQDPLLGQHPAGEAGFSVTFAMNKFQPATVPVQVIQNPGDFTTPASTTIDPNPVIAELKPVGPPPSRFAPSPSGRNRSRPRARPRPPRRSQSKHPARALACESDTARLWVHCNLPTLC